MKIFKDLRDAVTALNESGLLKNKIIMEGAENPDILKQFMASIVAIPDDKNGKSPTPKEALDFYNSILDSEEIAAGMTKIPQEKEN